ncbi:hypothetical protein [Streptomyces sp. NPDC002564]|uniref:hypothetical protein n=1 Tax=Streptomyces sp. NPDC002564 TaxID=3364649 RepID=UPI00369B9630
MKIHSRKTAFRVIAPLVMLIGLGAATAPTATAADNNWKCTSKSWKSADDPGGRDSKVILRNPRDSTDHFALNWEAKGEKLYAVNASSIYKTEYRATFQGIAEKWYWILKPGETVVDNLDLPEGHHTQISAASDAANIGRCYNNNGRT